jgi:hypothetical protein
MSISNQEHKQVTLRFKYRNLLVNKNILPLSLSLKSDSVFEYVVREGTDYDKLVTILQKWFDYIQKIED